MKPKVLKAWLLGYHEERKAYLLLTTDTRKLITSRDVVFAEGPYVHHCLGKIANEIADMEDGTDLPSDSDTGLIDTRGDHKWMADVTGVGEPLGSGGISHPLVVLRHVPSTDQLADLLTKPLTRVCFERLRSLLGMGTDVVAKKHHPVSGVSSARSASSKISSPPEPSGSPTQ